MKKEKIRDIVIIAFLILFVPMLVLYSYMFANSAAHLNPEGTFANPTQDTSSSFKITFKQVANPDVHIENCSGWVFVGVVNSSWSVWFGPSNFTGPNLTLHAREPSSVEVENEWENKIFTIYYTDINNSGRIDFGDTLRIVFSEPLPADVRYNIQINYLSPDMGTITLGYETFYT